MKNLSIRQIKCLITLILAVFLCGAPAVAQTQKIAVKLDMTKVPMKTVMNEIEKQTKYLFLYTDEIDTKRIVSIKADSKPLNEVLPLLFKDTDITYEITVPNIVLSKRVAAARPTAISGVVKDSGGLGIIGATVLIKGTTVGTTTARVRLSTSRWPIRPSRSSRSSLRPWASNVPRKPCRTTCSR